ncbi:GDP-mannose 4,6-dehydratase [Myxococcota bacterium]|nr:GDP-mannose 4,6-dehydratase [Myxococcota bacterium]
MPRQTILLTGGAGFIGSHVGDRLRARGDRVVVLDDFNDYYDPAIKRANVAAHAGDPDYRIVEGDLSDPVTLARLPDEPFDAVIHLAARAGVRPSVADPALYARVNVTGTVMLLEWARTRGVRRFVMASSSSVYGKSAVVPFSEDDRADQPISPYAASKRATELHAAAFHHLYGTRVACLRFFTVFGPRQRPDLAIASFIRRIDRGEPIPVYGDGGTARDYTYVDDTLQGVLAALEWTAAPEPRFGCFNLGNCRTVTLSRMIETIEEALGRKAVRRVLPEQPGDVPITWADLTRARAALGYDPQVPFEEGIARQVAWYRDAGRP